MIFQLEYTLLLLTIIPTVLGGASNSYADCLQVASQFATTVSNGPVANILAATGVNVTCPQLTGVSCPGTVTNGVCVFQQKLCITCLNQSPVRIRVQSNGLPRRCTTVPLNAAISEVNIDFEVNFNPDVSVNSPNQSPSTAGQLSNILCNITSQSTVPSTSNYVQYASTQSLSVTAGIAVDGVHIFNVNSANQVDPFYPTGGFTAEGADQCLSHPGGGGEFHYHSGSGCMLNPPSGNLSGCSPTIGCLNNVGPYSVGLFSSYRTLTVIGIAKDGHIIYGPYLSSGTQVTSGFDICNGMFHDSIGNYGYFATSTYPYITGCFGPGNYPNFLPNCTTNPPSSYTKSIYTSSSSTSNDAASNIPSSIILSFTLFITILNIATMFA